VCVFVVRLIDVFTALLFFCIVVEQTGMKKKSGVKGKKAAGANAEKEEPMEKELSVSWFMQSVNTV